jgi:hypothetical protein
MRESDVEETSGFPLDDLTYDLITIIHAKSKALEAYGKYCEDAADHDEILSTLEEIRRQDEECVEQLQNHLTQMLNARQTQGAKSTSAASSSQGQSTVGRKGINTRR